MMMLHAKNINAILITHVRMYTAISAIFNFSSTLSTPMKFHLLRTLKVATTISLMKTYAGSRSLDSQHLQLITGSWEALSLLIITLATMHLIVTNQRLDLPLQARMQCQQLSLYLIPPMSWSQSTTQASTLTPGQAAHMKHQDIVELPRSSSASPQHLLLPQSCESSI